MDMVEQLHHEIDRLRFLLSDAANMADNAASHAESSGNATLAQEYRIRRDRYRTGDRLAGPKNDRPHGQEQAR